MEPVGNVLIETEVENLVKLIGFQEGANEESGKSVNLGIQWNQLTILLSQDI